MHALPQFHAPYADHTKHIVHLGRATESLRHSVLHDADSAGLDPLLHERALHKARRDYDMVRLGVFLLGLFHEARVGHDSLLAELRILRLQQFCLDRHMNRPHLQDRHRATSLRPTHGVQRHRAPAIQHRTLP